MTTGPGEVVDLFPQIEPYDTGRLRVDEIHELYYEQSGKPNGNPVLFIHGGPGGGTSPTDRCFFDPKCFRIILFDQRGSGKSTPPAELQNNTSWHNVDDIEKLREHLKIKKWMLFGGSWGSTLALLYAEMHPQRVKSMVLRGIFTIRQKEINWLYNVGGASNIYPDYWESYVSVIPEEERGDLVAAYHKRLTGDNEEEKLKCARSWSQWECSTSKLIPDQEASIKVSNDLWVMQFARIECHYMINGGFLEGDNYILDNAHKIKDIPCSIVQGRYDVICPPVTAWELHRKLPKSEIHFVTAGHFSKDPQIQSLLLKSVEKFNTL
ncbi:proline iminopeptidase-like [Asterias rubens]|uniref:proline iminopeptidase-like n=1 Tax=Asterias rubens TaxID=7604 RepID=UPI001455C67E|nr:proline iminopeptidase-like [Asterias rubens]